MKRFLISAWMSCLLGVAAIAANPVVEMKTSLGSIKIELAQDKAPVTVSNFLAYVDQKFYDGTVFHRVIRGFMNQGGGFAKEGTELVQKNTMPPIKNEAKTSGLRNQPGTIAMARTGDPHSATSQFFINVKNPNSPSGYNDALDFDKARDGVGYAVFGKVIEGMDVVNKINEVATTRRVLQARDRSGTLRSQPAPDVPTPDVVIESVRLVSGSGTSSEAPKP